MAGVYSLLLTVTVWANLSLVVTVSFVVRVVDGFLTSLSPSIVPTSSSDVLPLFPSSDSDMVTLTVPSSDMVLVTLTPPSCGCGLPCSLGGWGYSSSLLPFWATL